MSTSHEPSDTLLDQIDRLCQEIGRPQCHSTILEAALQRLMVQLKQRVSSKAGEESQRQAEHAQLHAEKEILDITLKGIREGVITTDVEGNVILINEEAETLLDWRQERAEGKPLREIFEIVDETTLETMPNPVEQVLATGKMSDLKNNTLLKTPNGKHHIIEHRGTPILNEEHRVIGAVLVIRDITEKNKLEEDRLRANKLDSVGFLAGGLAHDFNNLLTAMLGNISIAKMHIQESEEILEILTHAEKAGERAKSLTCQLLTFSQGGAPLTKPIEVPELIKESAEFVVTGSNVQCEFNFDNDLCPVEADEGQLNQVVNNLVINAIQAMPVGGKIDIRGKNLVVRKGDARLLSPGKYVKLSIEDQGIGIPKSYLNKIFDPYFTTKKLASQRGCGLGLATSYSIIKRHAGLMTVDSTEGAGSTFHVYLPASQKQPVRVTSRCGEPAKCNGHILVMDDEEILRQLSVEYLGRLGYKVTTACNGEEAIKLYRQARQQEPFDAVIMDLTVPGGMGGKETIKKLRKIDPSVKAVVSSGYSNDPIMAEYKRYGFDAVMAKPFQVNELGNLLCSLMN